MKQFIQRTCINQFIPQPCSCCKVDVQLWVESLICSWRIVNEARGKVRFLAIKIFNVFITYNGLSVTLSPLIYLKYSTNQPLALTVVRKSSWISPPQGEILSFPSSFLNIFPRITAFKSHPLAGILDFVSDVHTCPLGSGGADVVYLKVMPPTTMI